MEKNVTKTWRNYPFTHAPHKSRSYDVWFLRYKVQRTKFFAILGHFLPFDPLNNPKSQNFEETKKKRLEILWFYTCVPQMTIIWCMVSEISSATDRIFCHFGLFFAILPPPPPSPLQQSRKSKFLKLKKLLDILSFYTWVP